MAWFAGCTGSTPMRSTPMIFSYAPAAPNGRPSSTTERRVIWSEVTAIGSIPSSRPSALRLDRSDHDVRRRADEIVLDVLDGPQQAIADDFGRLPGVVRREHHARERDEGIARLERFVVEDVEAGARDLALPERVEQRVALDQGTAAGVDEDRGRLHQRKLATPEKAARLGRQAQVECDEVGLAADLVLGSGAGAQRADGGNVAAGAIGQDVHPEGLGERDDAGADLASAEDAECLAEQLGQKIAGPGASPHLTVDARDAPGRRQHERQRVLGHGESIDARRVAHRDPVTAGGVEVHVVRSGTPDRDQLELAARRHHALGEPRVGTDVDHDTCAVDATDELGLIVGAAGGEDVCLADFLAAFVRGRAAENGRKVVWDGYCNGCLGVGSHRGWPDFCSGCREAGADRGWPDTGAGRLRHARSTTEAMLRTPDLRDTPTIRRRRRPPGRRRRLRRARTCTRGPGAPARAPTGSATRSAGWRSCPQ